MHHGIRMPVFVHARAHTLNFFFNFNKCQHQRKWTRMLTLGVFCASHTLHSSSKGFLAHRRWIRKSGENNNGNFSASQAGSIEAYGTFLVYWGPNDEPDFDLSSWGTHGMCHRALGHSCKGPRIWRLSFLRGSVHFSCLNGKQEE